MGSAYYNIVARGEGWTIGHDGKDEGDYATKNRRSNPLSPELLSQYARGMR